MVIDLKVNLLIKVKEDIGHYFVRFPVTTSANSSSSTILVDEIVRIINRNNISENDSISTSEE